MKTTKKSPAPLFLNFVVATKFNTETEAEFLGRRLFFAPTCLLCHAMGRATLFVRPGCRFCPKVVRTLRRMIEKLEKAGAGSIEVRVV